MKKNVTTFNFYMQTL